jgi:hypothetical protein
MTRTRLWTLVCGLILAVAPAVAAEKTDLAPAQKNPPKCGGCMFHVWFNSCPLFVGQAKKACTPCPAACCEEACSATGTEAAPKDTKSCCCKDKAICACGSAAKCCAEAAGCKCKDGCKCCKDCCAAAKCAACGKDVACCGCCKCGKKDKAARLSIIRTPLGKCVIVPLPGGVPMPCPMPPAPTAEATGVWHPVPPCMVPPPPVACPPAYMAGPAIYPPPAPAGMPPYVTPQPVPMVGAPAEPFTYYGKTPAQLCSSNGAYDAPCSWTFSHGENGLEIKGPSLKGSCDRMRIVGGGVVVLEGHVCLHSRDTSCNGTVNADRICVCLDDGTISLNMRDVPVPPVPAAHVPVTEVLPSPIPVSRAERLSRPTRVSD